MSLQFFYWVGLVFNTLININIKVFEPALSTG